MHIGKKDINMRKKEHFKKNVLMKRKNRLAILKTIMKRSILMKR